MAEAQAKNYLTDSRESRNKEIKIDHTENIPGYPWLVQIKNR